MIARCNQHRNTAVFQFPLQKFQGLLSGVPVKQIACQQHHITVFRSANIRNFPGNLPLGFLQELTLLLCKAQEGGIQMPIGAV